MYENGKSISVICLITVKRNSRLKKKKTRKLLRMDFEITKQNSHILIEEGNTFYLISFSRKND